MKGLPKAINIGEKFAGHDMPQSPASNAVANMACPDVIRWAARRLFVSIVVYSCYRVAHGTASFAAGVARNKMMTLMTVYFAAAPRACYCGDCHHYISYRGYDDASASASLLLVATPPVLVTMLVGFYWPWRATTVARR